MALFFDQSWFDEQLSQRLLSKEIVATALQLTPPQIEEVWKDQRELSAAQVSALAALLNVSADEVAKRAGVATPVPGREASHPVPPSSPPASAVLSPPGASAREGELIVQLTHQIAQLTKQIGLLHIEMAELRKEMHQLRENKS